MGLVVPQMAVGIVVDVGACVWNQFALSNMG